MCKWGGGGGGYEKKVESKLKHCQLQSIPPFCTFVLHVTFFFY